MQIKAWVHVTWLVPGAGHRNEMADEGIRVREERVGFSVGFGGLRTGPAPAGHRSVNQHTVNNHSAFSAVCKAGDESIRQGLVKAGTSTIHATCQGPAHKKCY